MLVCGSRLRLTEAEHRLLSGLAGSDSRFITSTRQLELFVLAHRTNYPGRSPEEILLRRMLESFLPPRNSHDR
jgi:hypothetical protein